MPSLSQPPNGKSLVLFGVAALLIVATVPYWVPVRPAVSDSYIFGYNNRAGIALFVLLAMLGAAWTREKKLPQASAIARGMSRWLMWGGTALALALSAFMYRLTAPLGGFAEGVYFLQRLHLLAAGRVPYRDFEYAYGVAFLYGPLWASKILHTRLETGYYVVWMAGVALGVGMLFETVRLAGDQREDRAGVFAMLYAISLLGILTTGPNYLLLRFIAAVYFAVLVYRVRQREHGRWFSSLLVLISTAVLLVISPEMAVAFSVASVAYMAMNFRVTEKGPVIALCGMVCGLAALFAWANSLGVFATMRAFSSGGNNFPIYIAPAIAICFAAVWTALVYFGQRFRGGDRENVFLYLIAIAIVLLPAALGRCDPGHIFLYEMGLLLTVALILSRSLRIRLWLRVAVALYLLVVSLPALRVDYLPFTAKAAAQSQSPAMQKYAAWVLGKDQVATIRRDRVAPRLDAANDQYLAPFSYVPNGEAAYESSSLEYGYSYGMTNVLTPESVRLKLEEIEANPDAPLLLPRQWVSYCVRTADNSRELLSGLFGVPYIKEPVHEMNLYMPVCDSIRASYHYRRPRAGQELGEYDLWVRNQ